MKDYTVTAIATYFVTAESNNDAKDIVYEALLGNDNQNILRWGEVNLKTLVAVEGIHNTTRIDK